MVCDCLLSCASRALSQDSIPVVLHISGIWHVLAQGAMMDDGYQAFTQTHVAWTCPSGCGMSLVVQCGTILLTCPSCRGTQHKASRGRLGGDHSLHISGNWSSMQQHNILLYGTTNSYFR